MNTHMENITKNDSPTDIMTHTLSGQIVHRTELTRKYAKRDNAAVIVKSTGLFITSLIILWILVLVKLSAGCLYGQNVVLKSSFMAS